MKKVGLLTTLLVTVLLLTGCNKSVNVENEQERIFACGRSVSEYFGISDYSINWDKEEEAGASFVINGTVTYEENGTKREKAVECVVDMVDNSVTIHEINETEEPILNNQKTNTIITPFTGTSTFEELNTVVAQCEAEGFAGETYLVDITRQDFLLPYKDGYLGFDGGGNNGEGQGYYLTYRTLENPCTLVSKTPAIFFWVRNEGKVYVGTDLGTRVPQKKVKDLECTTNCEEEMNKFMYHLIVEDETQEYFSQWMTKFKDDIDKNIFRGWEYRREKDDECNERDFGIDENDPEFVEKSELAFQECIAEYLN